MTAAPAGGCHAEGGAVASARPVDFSAAPNMAIRVEDLWKQYRLGTLSHATLRQDLQSWWARLSGRDDPNARIASPGDATAVGGLFWALQGVSFEVRQGEVLGIIGRNGAGKSTLLKILSRVTAPSRGEIKIRGRIASLLEVGTGFHPELTGRENIFLNGAILGMRREEIRGKLDEIIAFSEIEHFIDTPVKRYSSGMYVRLAFAVAAHLEPEILVIDEVLAVGDFQFQKKCLGKMEAVGKEGRTVLFVSHNMGMVSQLCDRCLWLGEGKVAQIGETAAVVDAYLRCGLGEQPGVREFAADSEKPSQFRSVLVRGEGGPAGGEFSCDERLTLELTYEVRKRVQGLYLAFYLQNRQGVRVLFSDLRDARPEMAEGLDVGLYRFSVSLPPRLLSPDAYTVTVGSAAPFLGHVDHHADCCGFTLCELQTARPSRPGVIGLRLPWQLDEVGSAASRD